MDSEGANSKFKSTRGATTHTPDKKDIRLVRITKHCKISKAKYEKLLKIGAIKESTKYICHECLNAVSLKAINQEKSVTSGSEDSFVNLSSNSETKGGKASIIGLLETCLAEIGEEINNDIKLLYKSNNLCSIEALGIQK